MKSIIMLLILIVQINLIFLKVDNLLTIEWALAFLNCFINLVVDDD